MAAKFLTFCVVATVVTQGLSSTLPESRNVVELSLPDETVEHLTNALIGRGITIAKSFLDTLEACHVIFPNGAMYEAYPKDNLPQGTGITFMTAAQPYTSCAIGFKGVDVSRSGTYELISLVHHNQENYKSITRKRFHVNLRASTDV